MRKLKKTYNNFELFPSGLSVFVQNFKLERKVNTKGKHYLLSLNFLPLNAGYCLSGRTVRQLF